MKKLFVFASAVTLSTSALAGNMSDNNDMKAMHKKMNDNQTFETTLTNEDIERLHKDMTLNAMSEAGMEARLKMISTEEGRSYHKALNEGQKNTAG